MKATITIEFEIDGECKNISEVLKQTMLEYIPGTMLSENWDESDEWAIEITSIKTEIE